MLLPNPIGGNIAGYTSCRIFGFTPSGILALDDVKHKPKRLGYLLHCQQSPAQSEIILHHLLSV
jgi:hypothetical protein